MDESKSRCIFEIVESWSEIQLHRPLHATGYYLNSEFLYGHPKIQGEDEVMIGLYHPKNGASGESRHD